MMLFLTAKKIDGKVDKDRCHFILEQQSNNGPLCLTWEAFLKDRAIAFCVGAENVPSKVKMPAMHLRGWALRLFALNTERPTLLSSQETKGSWMTSNR